MFRVIACIQNQHDHLLVALATGICLLGCLHFNVPVYLTGILAGLAGRMGDGKLPSPALWTY